MKTFSEKANLSTQWLYVCNRNLNKDKKGGVTFYIGILEPIREKNWTYNLGQARPYTVQFQLNFISQNDKPFESI